MHFFLPVVNRQNILMRSSPLTLLTTYTQKDGDRLDCPSVSPLQVAAVDKDKTRATCHIFFIYNAI